MFSKNSLLQLAPDRVSTTAVPKLFDKTSNDTPTKEVLSKTHFHIYLRTEFQQLLFRSCFTKHVMIPRQKEKPLLVQLAPDRVSTTAAPKLFDDQKYSKPSKIFWRPGWFEFLEWFEPFRFSCFSENPFLKWFEPLTYMERELTTTLSLLFCVFLFHKQGAGGRGATLQHIHIYIYIVKQKRSHVHEFQQLHLQKAPQAYVNELQQLRLPLHFLCSSLYF